MNAIAQHFAPAIDKISTQYSLSLNATYPWLTAPGQCNQ